MRDLDPTIDAALAAEERELLARVGEDEAGQFRQLASLFSGRNSWFSMMIMCVLFLLFCSGAWATWNFFQATTPLAALHWGIPAATLLIFSLMLKLALWPQVQTNRLLLAMKRVELQIARTREQASSSNSA